jgi:hypothetical protein
MPKGKTAADKLPPHAPEAEAGILSCILQNPAKLREAIAAGVHGRHFYDLRHREIFCELTTMSKAGAGADLLALQSRLKTTGREELADLTFLTGLQDAAPSAENLTYYLPDLKAAFHRRTALEIAARLESAALDPQAAADALTSDAEEALRSLRQMTAAELPAIVDASTFTAATLERPRELVHGLLHQGSKLALGGASKSNKTWTFIDLALSVSHGSPWLGLKTSKGRVLYLNLEIQDWSFSERIKAVAHAKSIKLQPGQLELWNLRGKSAEYSELFPKITERIQQAGHALIVLDPIYKLYGTADENKAGDVARLLNEIENLAIATGAAVAFAAHFSKGNQASKESIDRISGSGVFARDPDSILIFTKHEVDGAFVVESTLRNFKVVPPFVVRWDFPLMRPDQSLDPAKLKQPNKGGRSAQYSAEMLLAYLPKEGATTSEWQETVSEETGMSRRKFFDLLGEVEQQAAVTRTKGKWLATTPSAESAETA